MSPRPRAPSAGGPSPRRRWTVPCLVPPGTRSFFVPCSVGTSTSAPRIASVTVIGTSTSKWSPLRRKTGDSSTRQTTNRSPDGPPRRPASPLPGRRIREPSLTPAGMLTLYFLSSRVRPAPWHVGQGCSITVPEPPHWWHGRVMENRPWPSDSTPRPLQTGQTIGLVPGCAPVPRHVGQAACVATDTGTCAPWTAWSKARETVVSRSRPRSSTVRARPPRPAVVLKMPERMSEKPPKSALVAPPPAPPPPNGLPAPQSEPPRSYFLR